ncbi:MAG: histidine kinase [Actinomycetota bacterium]|nr:histidine kinase [Actinomycetota bacterium]
MTLDDPPPRGRKPPLLWRVFLTNAAAITAAFLLLAFSPATVQSPLQLEGLVSTAGLVVLLLVNLFFMRRAFAPLGRLAAFMRRVDPLRPGPRIPSRTNVREVEDLTRAFNDMLDRLETERRESARRALAAQEGERRRLARELHDEIGQDLTAMLLKLESALRGADPSSRERLLDLRESARQTLQHIGTISRQLRPEALDDLGLKSALVSLTDRVAEGASIEVRRSLETDLPALTSEAELVVYRVAQESLTNAVRHGGGSWVEVSLRRTPTGVQLRVTDDGHGLDGAAEGSGISGMRERALLVGGDLEFGASSAGGVEVRLEVVRASLEA